MRQRLGALVLSSACATASAAFAFCAPFFEQGCKLLGHCTG
jgi:hypothetical protein